jgi:ElaB/YqjD/DUF883 family membrane-anchored ribosome-binding protein
MPTESIPFPTTPDDAGRATNTANGEWIDRLAQTAHQTIDRVAETAAPKINRLQEGLAHAGDSVHQRADQMREMRDEWTESLRCTVRENPLAALGVALAVGVLIARLAR